MYLTKTPKTLKKLYPRLIWDIASEDKSIYLTFDDGPTPQITPWTLECLSEHKAKATFFCIGKNMERHPEIVQQIIDKGHSIGNHTWSHENGWKTTLDDYQSSILKTEELLHNLNVNNKLFRPPYGRIKKKQIKSLHEEFQIIMWDVLSADFDTNISKEKCLQNCIENADKGSIIVFHDSVKAFERLSYTLPKVLTHFSQKVYTFKSLS
ncbi:MAG: polysaccharide deacetylase family protein [Flavobacteriaceae bacterium]|nr:polysaccharide deacetylase family protein [Flavobacteriaceae bacterium]